MKVLVVNEFNESKTVELSRAPEIGDKMRFDSTSMLTTVWKEYPAKGVGEFADLDHDHVVVI